MLNVYDKSQTLTFKILRCHQRSCGNGGRGVASRLDSPFCPIVFLHPWLSASPNVSYRRILTNNPMVPYLRTWCICLPVALHSTVVSYGRILTNNHMVPYSRTWCIYLPVALHNTVVHSGASAIHVSPRYRISKGSIYYIPGGEERTYTRFLKTATAIHDDRHTPTPRNEAKGLLRERNSMLKTPKLNVGGVGCALKILFCRFMMVFAHLGLFP